MSKKIFTNWLFVIWKWLASHKQTTSFFFSSFFFFRKICNSKHSMKCLIFNLLKSIFFLRIRMFVAQLPHFLITNDPDVGNSHSIIPSLSFTTHTCLKFILPESEAPIPPRTAAENRPECNSATRRRYSSDQTNSQMIVNWEATGFIARPKVNRKQYLYVITLLVDEKHQGKCSKSFIQSIFFYCCNKIKQL